MADEHGRLVGGAQAVSLDYPYYEELCRRRHPAAWWWRIGDNLYYLGLLPAMIAVPGAAVGLGAGLLGRGWQWLAIAGVTFPVAVVVFFDGASLKGYAYTLAERDGISSAEVYRRGAINNDFDTPDKIESSRVDPEEDKRNE